MRILNKRSHILLALPVALVVCALIALSPFIVGYLGCLIETRITGQECNEANSIFGVLPWYCFVTIPAAFVLAGVVIVMLVLNFIALGKKVDRTTL